MRRNAPEARHRSNQLAREWSAAAGGTRALERFSPSALVFLSQGSGFSGRAADHDRGDGRRKTDKTASPMPNGGMAEVGF